MNLAPSSCALSGGRSTRGLNGRLADTLDEAKAAVWAAVGVPLDGAPGREPVSVRFRLEKADEICSA
jgi:hypothetical protein